MITTLTGSNSYALSAALATMRDGFVQAHGGLALEQLDGEEASYQQIVDALQGLPFLATHKMVIVRSAAAQKQLLEKLEELLPMIPDTTDVVLVIPKVDKRAKYAKILQKQTDFTAFEALDELGLAKWLVDTAKRQKGTLGLPDARLLVERVGTDQAILANELDKLLTYNPQISKQTIELLSEPLPRSTIFQLMDAAFGGDTKQALTIYEDQRAQKVEPLAILGMIAWQLQILAIVKTAGQRSPEEIAKTAKLHPFVVRKNTSIVRKLTLSQLKKLVKDAFELDIRLKSQGVNADDALRYYILNLAN